jgi:hypothetical protein
LVVLDLEPHRRSRLPKRAKYHRQPLFCPPSSSFRRLHRSQTPRGNYKYFPVPPQPFTTFRPSTSFFPHNTLSAPNPNTLVTHTKLHSTLPASYNHFKRTTIMMSSSAATPSAPSSKVPGSGCGPSLEPSPASTYGESAASDAGESPQTPGGENDGAYSKFISSFLHLTRACHRYLETSSSLF